MAQSLKKKRLLGLTASTGGGVSYFAITINRQPVTINGYQITITGVQ